MEWGELAKHLNLSRSMLDQVRKGRRHFGPKAMRRILEAEADVGLAQHGHAHVLRESPGSYSTTKRVQMSLAALPPDDARGILEAISTIEKCLGRIRSVIERAIHKS